MRPTHAQAQHIKSDRPDNIPYYSQDTFVDSK